MCDFWTKLLEVLSKNVFLDIHCKQWSDGPKMSSVQPMSSLINPVSVALLFNPFGDVEVIICPFVNFVKRNWLNRTHILGPSLQCLQWFVMQAATMCGHVIQDGHNVN